MSAPSASALDARSNIQTAIDPLPLSEEPFIHSEDDSSDSVDDEELQTFSIIVSPRKYVDEEDIKCRARQLVQEAWSMNFVWDITEIRNVDPESEALSEGMEEPPALMECPNWEDEVDFEILDTERAAKCSNMMMIQTIAEKQMQKALE